MPTAEYLAFLDKRIPELQNEGKPYPPSDHQDTSIETVARRIRKNLEGSEYPGRAAREQADNEWAERNNG